MGTLSFWGAWESPWVSSHALIGRQVDTRQGRGVIMYAWPPGAWESYGVKYPAWTVGVQLGAGGLAIFDELEVIEVRPLGDDPLGLDPGILSTGQEMRAT